MWSFTRLITFGALVMFALPTPAAAAGRHNRQAPKARPAAPNSNARHYRLDGELTFRAAHHEALRKTRAIVTLQPGASLPHALERFAARKLDIINGYVVDLPNGMLKLFAAHPSIFRIHYDRPAAKFDARTSLTTGSAAVTQSMGLTGAGIGVAVIDSGVTMWHDDLTNRTSALYPYGDQRVSAFVDFVNGALTPYDDNGHGTHVAGLIAGNGYDSNGLKGGVAPDASLVSLKVLDANGVGTISNVIAALEWVLANHATYNIRVVNLSVGAAIRESYWTDPLTLAAKRVVDAGVVVVSAAGNFGKNEAGLPQYGGINAPANAPWVLTVGASTTNGTATRTDDAMASFSSRGPTYLDWSAKPDLVAPGVGVVSLADASSTFYQSHAQYLVSGSMLTAFQPYLSLSGTSMAAPIVSGTVALMLQANPSLTPNAVKALLQYTAQVNDAYDPLTEGAGFLNAFGAVRLAGFYANAQPGQTFPMQEMWGKQIIWGNHLLTGGVVLPDANAWSLGTTWGAAMAGNGDNVVWGTARNGDNVVWGTAAGDNVVWGTDCGGADCDTVAWGTADGDNVVWGTARDGDNVVWGTANGDNIVWGTYGGDNVVWGTADGDNVVWGTDSSANLAWGTSAEGAPVLVGDANALTDEEVFALLGQPPSMEAAPLVTVPDSTILEISEPTIFLPSDPIIETTPESPLLVTMPDPQLLVTVPDDTLLVVAPDSAIITSDPLIVTPEPAIVEPAPTTDPVVIPLGGIL